MQSITQNPTRESQTATEPTDPFLMGLARGVEDMESTPWTPKFEDPDQRTAEEGEESVEVGGIPRT